MSVSATSVLIAIVVGIISSIVTIFLTPPIQFYFWGKQRLSEIRLAAIAEINKLLADFLTNYMSNQEYHPDDQFYASFNAASANIKALFSKKAFDIFKELEVMIGHNLGPAKGAVHVVVRVRDEALLALYQDAIGYQPKQIALVESLKIDELNKELADLGPEAGKKRDVILLCGFGIGFVIGIIAGISGTGELFPGLIASILGAIAGAGIAGIFLSFSSTQRRYKKIKDELKYLQMSPIRRWINRNILRIG